MPRRNGKATKPRLKRREKAQGPKPITPRQRVTVDVEALIVPDGRCCGKVFFDTREKADKALRQAQVRRRQLGASNAEKRVYDDCDRLGRLHYHLTSRENAPTKETP